MHDAAFEWVGRYASADPLRVLDIGGRNINGTCRDHFPGADYTSLDVAPGVGVDVVADAATWTPDREYDVVVCAEVFEHTNVWREIITTAYRALAPGGRFVVTCAGPGRAPHSAIDGGAWVRAHEHYGNVTGVELFDAMIDAEFVAVSVNTLGEDTRGTAVRP